MGRKAAASGMSSGGFTKYASLKASEAGLGLGNFGETDRWMGSIDSDEEAAVDDYSGDAYKWPGIEADCPITVVGNTNIKRLKQLHRGT